MIEWKPVYNLPKQTLLPLFSINRGTTTNTACTVSATGRKSKTFSRIKNNMRCPHCQQKIQVYRNPVPTVDIIIEVEGGHCTHQTKEPAPWLGITGRLCWLRRILRDCSDKRGKRRDRTCGKESSTVQNLLWSESWSQTTHSINSFHCSSYHTTNGRRRCCWSKTIHKRKLTRTGIWSQQNYSRLLFPKKRDVSQKLR